MNDNSLRIYAAAFLLVSIGSWAFCSDKLPTGQESISQQLAHAQSQLSAQPTDDITTQQQYIDFLKSNYTNAEKTIDALVDRSATLEEQKEILRKRIIILENLHALGDESAGPRLNELLKTKLADKEPAISRVARRFVLVSHAGQFFQIIPERQQKVLTDIQNYVLKYDPCVDGAAVASALISQLMQATDLTMAADFSQEVATHFSSSQVEEMKELASKFEGTAKQASLPGKPLEVTGQTLKGDAFDITTIKDKVVLVDFWSSGCPHCHAEAPQLKELYSRLQPKGFEIVGVTLYDTSESAQAYVIEKGITWPILFDQSAAGSNKHPIATKYAITAVPTAILVGRDGKVISIQARGEELQRLLEEQFPGSNLNLSEQN